MFHVRDTKKQHEAFCTLWRQLALAQHKKSATSLKSCVTSQRSGFAAITVYLDDDHACAVFRGTDATLVGWKEDFNMAFLPVIPSQADAADYVTKLGKSFPGKLLLMGHSKGGNLAAYAGMFCDPEIQKRIERVYPLDSPGFIGNTLESEEYGRIQSRVHKVIPKGSLIGMLLENHGAYSVVESNQMGIMQHDPFSWQVTDGAFHTLEEISSGAKYMNKTLNSWITGMSIDERIRLVDVLWLLTAGNMKTYLTLATFKRKNIGAIYNAAVHLDPKRGRSFCRSSVSSRALRCTTSPTRMSGKTSISCPAIKRRIKFP